MLLALRKMNIYESHHHYKEVLEVCKKLTSSGFIAWFAGGCVRDAILGVQAKDFDIATNATPEEIQKIFPNSLDIGKQFGIIMVPFQGSSGGFQVEVATFRKDGEYKDGRRPEAVTFTSPEEDAKRRDFTINALFYDPLSHILYDFVEGKKDISLKIIRAVGDPNLRFEEDKLRMLRAVRFSAQLDFEIEPTTLKAIQKKRQEVSVVSKERIYQELTKMMLSQGLLKGLEYLRDTRLHEVIFENFKQFKEFEGRFQKSMQLLKNFKNLNEISRWSLFFHPFFENTFNSLGAIETFMQEYKFSSSMIKSVLKNFDLMKWMETFSSKRKGEILEFIFSHEGKEFLTYFAELTPAPQDLEKLGKIIELRSLYKELPKPLITGDDLIQMGHKPNTEFKKILKSIYYHQLENKISSKETLLNWTKNQKF